MNPVNKWTGNHVRRWIKDNKENFRISKEGIRQPNGKRIRFWCVKNHKWWFQYRENHDVIEAHFEDLIDTTKVNQTTFDKQQEAYNG